jgi:hypothetical protein
MLTYSDILCAADEGRTLSRPFIDNPTTVTVSGIYTDMTFFGRYPAANYLTSGAQNTATQLKRSTDGGIDHGEDKGAGYRKYLTGVTLGTTTAGAVPLVAQIMDYLLYYPLIPMEDVQEMVNVETLPRYVDGKGVQIMLVEQFPYIGGITCRVTYTNSDGVAGRVSPIMTINTQATLGTIATSAPATAGCCGLFVPLQDNDGGVRSVESIEFFSPDAGNLAIILVKPLATAYLYETTCHSEWDYLRDMEFLPVIEDENNRDAMLSMVCRSTGSMSGAIIDSQIRTTWVEI